MKNQSTTSPSNHSIPSPKGTIPLFQNQANQSMKEQRSRSRSISKNLDNKHNSQQNTLSTKKLNLQGSNKQLSEQSSLKRVNESTYQSQEIIQPSSKPAQVEDLIEENHLLRENIKLLQNLIQQVVPVITMITEDIQDEGQGVPGGASSQASSVQLKKINSLANVNLLKYKHILESQQYSNDTQLITDNHPSLFSERIPKQQQKKDERVNNQIASKASLKQDSIENEEALRQMPVNHQFQQNQHHQRQNSYSFSINDNSCNITQINDPKLNQVYQTNEIGQQFDNHNKASKNVNNMHISSPQSQPDSFKQKFTGKIINLQEIQRVRYAINNFQSQKQQLTHPQQPQLLTTEGNPYEDTLKSNKQQDLAETKKSIISRNSSNTGINSILSGNISSVSEDDVAIPFDTLKRKNVLNQYKFGANLKEISTPQSQMSPQNSASYRSPSLSQPNIHVYNQQQYNQLSQQYPQQPLQMQQRLEMVYPKPTLFYKNPSSNNFMESCLSLQSLDSKINEDHIFTSDKEDYLDNYVISQRDLHTKEGANINDLENLLAQSVKLQQNHLLVLAQQINDANAQDDLIIKQANGQKDSLDKLNSFRGSLDPQLQLFLNPSSANKSSLLTHQLQQQPFSKNLTNIDEESQSAQQRMATFSTPLSAQKITGSVVNSSRKQTNKENYYDEQELQTERQSEKINVRSVNEDESLPEQEILAIKQMDMPVIQQYLPTESDRLTGEQKDYILTKSSVLSSNSSNQNNKNKQKLSDFLYANPKESLIQSCSPGHYIINPESLDHLKDRKQQERVNIEEMKTIEMRYEDIGNDEEAIINKFENLDSSIYSSVPLAKRNYFNNNEMESQTILNKNMILSQESQRKLDEMARLIQYNNNNNRDNESSIKVSDSPLKTFDSSFQSSPINNSYSRKYQKLAESVKQIKMQSDNYSNQQQTSTQSTFDQKMTQVITLRTPSPNFIQAQMTILDTVGNQYDPPASLKQIRLNTIEEEVQASVDDNHCFSIATEGVGQMGTGGMSQRIMDTDDDENGDAICTFDKETSMKNSKLDNLLNEFLRGNNQNTDEGVKNHHNVILSKTPSFQMLGPNHEENTIRQSQKGSSGIVIAKQQYEKQLEMECQKIKQERQVHQQQQVMGGNQRVMKEIVRLIDSEIMEQPSAEDQDSRFIQGGGGTSNTLYNSISRNAQAPQESKSSSKMSISNIMLQESEMFSPSNTKQPQTSSSSQYTTKSKNSQKDNEEIKKQQQQSSLISKSVKQRYITPIKSLKSTDLKQSHNATATKNSSLQKTNSKKDNDKERSIQNSSQQVRHGIKPYKKPMILSPQQCLTEQSSVILSARERSVTSNERNQPPQSHRFVTTNTTPNRNLRSSDKNSLLASERNNDKNEQMKRLEIVQHKIQKLQKRIDLSHNPSTDASAIQTNRARQIVNSTDHSAIIDRKSKYLQSIQKTASGRSRIQSAQRSKSRELTTERESSIQKQTRTKLNEAKLAELQSKVALKEQRINAMIIKKQQIEEQRNQLRQMKEKSSTRNGGRRGGSKQIDNTLSSQKKSVKHSGQGSDSIVSFKLDFSKKADKEDRNLQLQSFDHHQQQQQPSSSYKLHLYNANGSGNYPQSTKNGSVNSTLNCFSPVKDETPRGSEASYGCVAGYGTVNSSARIRYYK